MKKIIRPFMLLVFPILITILACQALTNTNSKDIHNLKDIHGVWVGETQWLCGHDNPAWSTTVEFKSDGSLASTMSISTAPQSIVNGTWSLSENNIEIKFPKTTWTGKVSGGKMEGTMKNDDDDCKGSWSLTKK